MHFRSGVVKAEVQSSLQELGSTRLWPLAATPFSLPKEAPGEGDGQQAERCWGLPGQDAGQERLVVQFF